MADAAAVFAVGPSIVTHLREGLGIAQARLIVNGIHRPSAAQRDTPRPDDLHDRFVFLAAARYSRRKAFDELLEAFALVSDAHPDALLVLITDPPRTLRERIAELNLQDRVRILGPQPHEEVMQWMVWADLFALPSWNEAFGLVYGEALAAGTPVVMGDAGAASIIRPFDPADPASTHGWIVEPKNIDALADVLRTALSHREELPKMGQAGRELIASGYTWEANARHVIDAFSEAAHAQPAMA